MRGLGLEEVSRNHYVHWQEGMMPTFAAQPLAYCTAKLVQQTEGP